MPEAVILWQLDQFLEHFQEPNMKEGFCRIQRQFLDEVGLLVAFHQTAQNLDFMDTVKS